MNYHRSASYLAASSLLTSGTQSQTVLTGENLNAGTPQEATLFLQLTELEGRTVLRDGEVIKLTKDASWQLGISKGQIQWLGSGGFAAYGKDRKVKLDGNIKEITWGGTANFVGANDALIFGAEDSDATLIWQKKINLGGGERTVRVHEGVTANTIAAVRFDQGFSDGSLIFEGDGRIDLNVANKSLGGKITVKGAELRATGGGVLTNLSLLRIEQGGQFSIDNYDKIMARLGDTIPIELDAGTLAYWGHKSKASQEHIGLVTLTGGANEIDIINNSATKGSQFSLGGLVRSGSATLNITNSPPLRKGKPATGRNAWPTINFHNAQNQPGLTHGILPWATIQGRDFATIKAGNIIPVTDYDTREWIYWTESSNASPVYDQTIERDTQINSLRLTGGRTIRLEEGSTLRIGGAALLASGSTLNKIQGGQITSSATELFAHVYGSGGLEIDSALHLETTSLIKTGDGTLRLSGSQSNTARGANSIHQGTLVLAKTGGALALGGAITVGDRGDHDATLRLEGNEQISKTSRVTLHGRPRLKNLGSGTKFPKAGRAILQFGGTHTGGLHQSLDTLHIDGTGLLDFQGGSTTAPNILQLQHLTFADPESLLLIRGWEACHDHLLVSRAAGAEVAHSLSQIKFEGYEETYLIDYNTHYFEIVPILGTCVPEPSTFGLILSALSLGFFAWRKRGKFAKSHP